MLYDMLRLYMVNMQNAYEKLQFSKAYKLTLDFLKNVVRDFYLQNTKNKVISKRAESD